jgi:GTPase
MEHRLCPIFRISNVTGEGLDYVGFYIHLWLARILTLFEDSHVLESPSI